MTYKLAFLLSITIGVFAAEIPEEKGWRFEDAGMAPAPALRQKNHAAPAVQKGIDVVVLDSIYMDPSKRMPMEEYAQLFAFTQTAPVSGTEKDKR